MVQFQLTQEDDAAQLTAIQKRAFDSQVPPEMPDLGGPPGYDSVDHQIDMMRRGPYYKVLVDDAIVGGIILDPKSPNHCHVEIVFIDPLLHSQGIGTQAFHWLEATHPQYTLWTLRTPAFHKRNQRFYERLGYVKVGETEVFPGFILFLYEKNKNF